MEIESDALRIETFANLSEPEDFFPLKRLV